MSLRICSVVIACMVLSSCASLSPNGRMRMTAPNSVSAVYSEMDMKLSLVTEANTVSPCVGAECEIDRAFDQKVLRLGTGLAQSAFEAYPDLAKRFDKFEFVIAEKAHPGIISSTTGRVVIFRGVQKLELDDETLAFLIAREMGHVICRHHDENSATRILFSVLAAVFMPVSNFISGSAALVQTASTSAISVATASAASFFGSNITIANHKLDQLHEADVIALNLLDRQGWKRIDIADALITSTRVMGDDSWSKGLRVSAEDALRLASAKNSITGLHIDSSVSGKTVIKVGLSQPLGKLPAGFTTDDPPRIVLDFLNTTNGLGTSLQKSSGRDLHSTNIVQTAGRTRLVVNLNRTLSYNTRIEGDNLLITLRGKDTNTTALNNALSFAEIDPAPY